MLATLSSMTAQHCEMKRKTLIEMHKIYIYTYIHMQPQYLHCTVCMHVIVIGNILIVIYWF